MSGREEIPPAGDVHPWPADHAAAAALVARQLPGVSLDPAGDGDLCLAFRQGGQIVRVARHRQAADALRREACVMAAIAERLPLPVPRPVFTEPAAGCAFSVHAEVTGEVLTRKAWEDLPEPVQESSAAELAHFLVVLHTLDPGPGVTCGVPVLDQAEYAGRLLQACGSLHPLLPADAVRRLEAALADWSRADDHRAPAFLHRDMAPGHVLHDPPSGRLTGVIDFGDLALGDRARDFIFIYEDFGEAMLDAVLRHYTLEDAAALRPRIHMWFLLETVDWTVGRYAEGDLTDTAHGLAIIAHELDVLGA